MAGLLIGSLLTITVLARVGASPVAKPTKEVDLRMPGVKPQQPDTYLCIPMQVEEDALYINKFVPHANMSIAHHMLLYACEEPGETKGVWQCGEMANPQGHLDAGPVCKQGQSIIYAWAMGAPELTLPKDVAFKVGASTKAKWLVLQVHYKDVTKFLPPINDKDDSGITLQTTTVAAPKRAGVYLLGTGGELAPKSTVYMETACSFGGNQVIHPFAYRVHAHKHGEVVSGYRVRDGKWEEIGRMSPKEEQMFYPVTHAGIEVKPGDTLAARCTMVNDEERVVRVGSTQNDEMCNFYVMYWVDGNNIPENEPCFTSGPPYWSWENFNGIGVENKPADISMIPGTDKVFEETAGRMIQEAEEMLDGSEEQVMALLRNFEQQMKDGYLEGEDENTMPFSDEELNPGYEVYQEKFGVAPFNADFERLREEDPREDWGETY